MENEMIIRMPSGRQTYDFDCGAKSLQLVMAYHGIDVREDVLIKELECDEFGTLVRNIRRVAEKYGLKPLMKRGMSLVELEKHIDSLHPVIVLVQAWADRYLTVEDWKVANEFGHYVVVIGYQDDKIIFEDPASFPRTWMTQKEFLARWHYTDIRTGKKMDHLAIVLSGKEPVQTGRMEHMD
jgi:predicted double-glycine peptidase